MRVLFLYKSDDLLAERAMNFCQSRFAEVDAYCGDWGDDLPAEIRNWRGDLIISYLSRWILSEKILESATLAAINFHPGSPDYPGIGCVNFALYDNAKEFGASCHRMERRVDRGAIIAVSRFPVSAGDDVASLTARTYHAMYDLFEDIIGKVANGGALVASGDVWSRTPYTRSELNRLSQVSPEMSAGEMARRVRATSFGHWQPTLELHGFRFEFKPG